MVVAAAGLLVDDGLRLGNRAAVVVMPVGGGGG